MRKKSKYDACRQKIGNMLAAGMNYKQITEALVADGIPARMSGLYRYCLLMDEPIGQEPPTCKGCKYYYTPEAVSKKTWHIRICLKRDKQISGSCATSPRWCPRRKQ